MSYLHNRQFYRTSPRVRDGLRRFDEFDEFLEDAIDEALDEAIQAAPTRTLPRLSPRMIMAPPANRGSRDYIRWVQINLNRILGIRLTIDGISGVQTRNAIRRFQRLAGLPVDGIVGSRTEASLRSFATVPRVGGQSPSRPLPPGWIDLTDSPGRRRIDNFITGDHNLLPEHRVKIAGIAGRIATTWLTPFPINVVHCVGHTDETGEEWFNYDLRLRRADKVKEEFEKALLNRPRNPGITIKAVRGSRKPIEGTDNKTEAGRARNRSVEVFLYHRP